MRSQNARATARGQLHAAGRVVLRRAGLARVAGPGPDAPAGEDDIYAAYRLLLGREPDPGGLADYRRRLGTLTRRQLADELIGSVEFSRRRPPDDRELPAEAVEVDGFTIMVDPADWAVGATIAAVRRYEPEVTGTARRLLGPGATFVDVGANIGWFALLAASVVGSAGSVLAVEPNPRNTDLLAASRERNGFSTIDVVTGAVSDRPGWLALETDASNGRVIPLGSIAKDSEAVRCSYAVPAFTLDLLLAERGIERVEAVKVDVEGVETAVFAGAEHLLTDLRPSVIFEWYPEALRSTGGVEPDAPLRLLRDHGYAISVIGHGSGEESLRDEEIEAVRVASGRDNLDLLARPRG